MKNIGFVTNINNLYSSHNVIRVTKSRKIRWAGYVARMREMRISYRVWWGNLSEGDHLEDPGVVERIILNGSLRSRKGV
jgi:hypothetical protein